MPRRKPGIEPLPFYVAVKMTGAMRDELWAIARKERLSVSAVIRLMIQKMLTMEISGARIEKKGGADGAIG